MSLYFECRINKNALLQTRRFLPTGKVFLNYKIGTTVSYFLVGRCSTSRKLLQIRFPCITEVLRTKNNYDRQPKVIKLKNNGHNTKSQIQWAYTNKYFFFGRGYCVRPPGGQNHRKSSL